MKCGGKIKCGLKNGSGVCIKLTHTRKRTHTNTHMYSYTLSVHTQAKPHTDTHKGPHASTHYSHTSTQRGIQAHALTHKSHTNTSTNKRSRAKGSGLYIQQTHVNLSLLPPYLRLPLSISFFPHLLTPCFIHTLHFLSSSFNIPSPSFFFFSQYV